MRQRTLSAADTVGARVRELRTRLGLSAQKVSDRCFAMGVELKQPVIHALERGRRQNVSLHEILVLAHALGTSPLALMLPKAGEAVELAPGVSLDPYQLVGWVAGGAWPGLPPASYERSTADVRLYLAIREAWEAYKAADRAARWTGADGDVVEEALRRYAVALDAAVDGGLRPPPIAAGLARKMIERGWLRHVADIELLPDFEEEAQTA